MELKNSNSLFKEAKELIPCQTQTLSKGYTQFVQGVSPVFLSRGEGSHVWDVDGNEFIDYIMALGPLVLGYNYIPVNKAIKNQLKEGISFSLPHKLEVELAKLVKQVIPCAEMVRYAKNGTDVTSAAIRVARAYTKREKIAYCGYHGASADWYGITSSLNKGIPQITGDYIFKFEYNKLETLEKIFSEHKDEIAAVIMEPVIFEEPKEDFLNKVKELAHQNGAVLIFDEMVTGFRLALGGAQTYYNVIPDLATFGKGIANGMPLSVLVGKKEIMQECENIFFSMTFGGETLSLAAAVASINEMKEKDIFKFTWKNGAYLQQQYNKLAKKYGLSNYTQCIGLPVKSMFEFKDEKGKMWWELKTLFLQETIKRGILFSGVNTISYSHKRSDIQKTIKAIDEAFITIKKALDEKDLNKYIEGSIVGPSIRRT